jgi:hypothetical protein
MADRLAVSAIVQPAPEPVGDDGRHPTLGCGRGSAGTEVFDVPLVQASRAGRYVTASPTSWVWPPPAQLPVMSHSS